MARTLLSVFMTVLVVVAVVHLISAGSPVVVSQSVASSATVPVATARTVHAGHAQRGLAKHLADCALARAYAALGAAMAGNPALMLSLDEQAKQRLDDARILLQESPIYTGLSATPAQVRAAVQPSRPSPEHAPPQASPAGSSGNTPSTASSALAPTHSAALTLDMAHAVDPAHALQESPQGPRLEQPGLWAKTSFNPDRQQQLVITDACSGGYAIAIYAADYSTIRLDGGLVVPGRFYQVEGHAVITGDTGCTVDIRPLAVVPTYSRGAVRLPQSNG